MTLSTAMVGFATGLVVGYMLHEAWAWRTVKRCRQQASHGLIGIHGDIHDIQQLLKHGGVIEVSGAPKDEKAGE